MNKRIINSIIFSFFIFHFSFSLVYAKIPEPDNIIYGLAREDAVTTAIEINGVVIASYTQGTNEGADGYYILRVPIDSFDPQVSDTARPGDTGYIYVNNETTAAATVIIGDRGTVQLINLVLDSDEDGLDDDLELIIGTNPNNPDTDGDGMKDGWEYDNGFDPLSDDAFGDADGDGCSNISEFTSGTDPNNPGSKANCHPIADAGPDQNDETSMEVALDGTDSFDPEGIMITFAWSFTDTPAGSAVTVASLTDSASAKPKFTTDLDGNYTLQLTVNDGALDSFVDDVVISASAPNVAPNADPGPDQNILTGSMMYLSGIKSNDPDNGPLALAFTWTFNVLPPTSALTDADIVDSDKVNANFIPDVDGNYEISLSVTDSALTDEDTIQVTAASTAVAPNADAGDDIDVSLGMPAICDGSNSSDPDSAPLPLTHSWSFVSVPGGSALTNGDISNANTVSPSITADVIGTYVLELMCDDGQYTDFDNVAVTVCDAGDTDCDGEPDTTDNCVSTPNVRQEDRDGDLVGDACDNCREVDNPDQRDTNAGEDDDSSLAGDQHYGNACDPDFDNDGLVKLSDFNVWRANYRQFVPPASPDLDLDNNGNVGLGDFNIWRQYYRSTPGPGIGD